GLVRRSAATATATAVVGRRRVTGRGGAGRCCRTDLWGPRFLHRCQRGAVDHGGVDLASDRWRHGGAQRPPQQTSRLDRRGFRPQLAMWAIDLAAPITRTSEMTASATAISAAPR